MATTRTTNLSSGGSKGSRTVSRILIKSRLLLHYGLWAKVEFPILRVEYSCTCTVNIRHINKQEKQTETRVLKVYKMCHKSNWHTHYSVGPGLAV